MTHHHDSEPEPKHSHSEIPKYAALDATLRHYVTWAIEDPSQLKNSLEQASALSLRPAKRVPTRAE